MNEHNTFNSRIKRAMFGASFYGLRISYVWNRLEKGKLTTAGVAKGGNKLMEVFF